MPNYVTLILLFTIAVTSIDSFVFPDQLSSKSWSGTGYRENSHDNSNSYGNHPSSYGHDHHPKYSGNYHGNDGDFALGFGNQPDYHNKRARRPNNAGIISQSQSNAHSTGIGSMANSEGGSQSFNGFSQSNAHAESQAHQSISSYPSGPSGNSEASSASSAASATSGIVNGVPVSSASAAAAAASSGGASSTSSSSSSSTGGFINRPGQLNPSYFRSRISGEDSDSSAKIDSSSSSVNNDRLIFSEK